MSAQRPPDVMIVGGGVIGCAIAYYLAREGVKVDVVERGEIGSEASRRGCRHAGASGGSGRGRPLPGIGPGEPSHVPRSCGALKQECGVDIEYLRSGILRVALTDKEAEQLGGFARRRPLPGLELHWLDPGELRAIEPGLSSAARGAPLLAGRAPGERRPAGAGVRESGGGTTARRSAGICGSRG